MVSDTFSAWFQLWRNSVLYHFRLMAQIGENCLHNVKKSMKLLNVHKNNLKNAFKHANGNPLVCEILRLPVCTSDSETSSKDSRSIMYLFVFVHSFYDVFDGQVEEFLTDMVNNSAVMTDERSRVLLQTLNILILSAKKSWQTLRSELSNFSENSIKKIGSNVALYRLCQAVYRYCKAMMLTHAFWVRDEGMTPEVLSEREQLYEDAVKRVNTVEKKFGSFSKICKYFCVHARLGLCHAIMMSKQHDLATAEKARKNSLKVLRDADLPILRPM